MIFKIWKDPVWSKVIATAILAIIASFYAGWLRIKNALLFIYNFFIATTPVPNWLIAVLIIPTLIFLLLILLAIKERFFGSKLHTYKDYISDNFLGLIWGWSYYEDGGICDVHSICPHCNYQILAKYESGYHVAPRYLFECDECGYNAGTIDSDYSEIEQKIKFKIQKNIRNGEWQNKV